MTYPPFHPWAGATRTAANGRRGLSPNFCWSSVRGSYASLRLPGGFRIGHLLARQRDQ